MYHILLQLLLTCLSLLLDPELIAASDALCAQGLQEAWYYHLESLTENSTYVLKDSIGCLHASMDVISHMTM